MHPWPHHKFLDQIAHDALPDISPHSVVTYIKHTETSTTIKSAGALEQTAGYASGSPMTAAQDYIVREYIAQNVDPLDQRITTNTHDISEMGSTITQITADVDTVQEDVTDIKAGHLTLSSYTTITAEARAQLKGDKGDKGDTGATGATGAPGVDGAPGINWGDGKMIHIDPMFEDGTNSVAVYEQTGITTTLTRAQGGTSDPINSK